jgi:hypothetical protein
MHRTCSCFEEVADQATRAKTAETLRQAGKSYEVSAVARSRTPSRASRRSE